MKGFTVTDIRNRAAFPDLPFRFSTLEETPEGAILSRDFIGENPLHYYADRQAKELTVASNICDIKGHLEAKGRRFDWNTVRAVSNNTRTIIDGASFASLAPKEAEIGPTLQEYEYPKQLDYSDLPSVAREVRGHLEASIEGRLATIPEGEIGILLSGGLDSMSVAYLLSRRKQKKLTAFTLRVRENADDIVQSRKMAAHFGIVLVEVAAARTGDSLSLSLRRFDSGGNLLHEKTVAEAIPVDAVIRDTLATSARHELDNLLCAASMFLIGKAVASEGIRTVFCGEGPNEMFNDYGFDPRTSGWPTSDKAHIPYREALTFGRSKSNLQHGRNGLPGHAIPRMGKPFAHYGIRLEAPYFDREIARILTRVPHVPSYGAVKQHFMAAMFAGEGLDHFIEGTTKQMFQDGSGVRGLFQDYAQPRLRKMLEAIYGIRAEGPIQRLARQLRPSHPL